MVDPSIYFQPLVEILDRFADKHNLKVEKYRRNLPQWSFSFQHPLGGNGRVDIQVNAQHEVSMVQWWIVSDYERHIRKLMGIGTFARGPWSDDPSQRPQFPIPRLEK